MIFRSDTIYEPSVIQVPVKCEINTPMAFKNKTQYKNAAKKVIYAVTKIKKERFSQIQNEKDYISFHLCNYASLEKIYYLALNHKDDEVEAWLEIILNKYRGFRCSQSYKKNKKLDYYFNKPSQEEIEFSRLKKDERIDYIKNIIHENIKNNNLKFLYNEI